MQQMLYPSIDLCYELSLKSLKQLNARYDSLDNKILAGLGIASGLIGFIPALAKSWIEIGFAIINIPFALAIVLYFSAVFFLIKAYWPKKEMIFFYDPRILLDNYATLMPEEAKVHLMQYFARNYESNYTLLGCKGKDAQFGFYCAIGETAFLVFRLVLG